MVRIFHSTYSHVLFVHDYIYVITWSVQQLGYGLDYWDSRVQFPAGARNFSLHHSVQTGSGAHPAFCPVGTEGSFPGVKQLGHGADHSPPSSAKVKNAWSYTSTLLISLHSVVLS
jgi:hypothetical protein